MTPGELVEGRFEIGRRVSVGGMGAIWRAVDRSTGRDVALKLLLLASGADRERFAREATLLAELHHPGIVRYVAHGTLPTSEAWLAMEWIEGETLQERLATRELGLRDAVRLARRIAEALGAAHARGVVHRDVKPANVILAGGEIERVKVLDFGIARQGLAQRVTATGALIGTPGYMSPEQARGDRDIDPRADVFALGCLLYRCLAFRPAFPGDAIVSVLARVAEAKHDPISGVRPELPGALAELVERMLSRDPEARPRDGADVAQRLADLEPTLDDAPPAAASSALGEAEQRLVAVVLAAPLPRSLAADLEATLTPGQVAQQRRELVAALRPLGLEPEWLADRTLLVTIAGETASDLAARAARAALLLRELMPEAPIAAATGRGLLTRSTLVGEVRDRAVELLRHAEAEGDGPRPISIDDATAGLLDARFDVVRGRTGLRGHELRGERRADDLERERALGGRLPFTGRDREMAMLDATIDECIEEHVARALVITGPAGVGKSRLASELVRRREDLTVLAARADGLARRSPFQLAAAIARRAVGVATGDADPRARVLAYARERLPEADRDRLAPFLGELVGAPFDDEADVLLRSARQDPLRMGDQVRRAFEALLRAECARRPVMLVLEDLHFGDLPSIKAIDGALRDLASSPLCVIGLARPELHDRFPELWAERGASHLRVAELGRRACERLVRSALGADADPARITEIVERCAGNALFLEEILRQVREHPERGTLPDSVVAMVHARLIELSPIARKVARAISVFGASAPAAGVRALIGDQASIDDALAELTDREVIEIRGEQRFARDRELAFRHAVAREAAYDMLTEEDRRLGHRLAGAYLEGAGERDAVLLAEHFERGGEPARALGFWERAAEQALEGTDFDAAVERAERAIVCGAGPERAAQLRLIQVEAFGWSARFAEMQRAAHEVMSILPSGGPEWSRAATSLLLIGGTSIPLAQAVEIVFAIAASPIDATSRPVQLRAHALAAILLMRAGQVALGEPILQRLEGLEAEIADPASLGWIALGRVYRARFGTRDPGVSREAAARAVELFTRGGDARGLSLALTEVGYCCVALGTFGDAIEATRAALRAAEGIGGGFVSMFARAVLGLALGRDRRVAEARDVLGGVVEEADRTDDGVNAGWSRHALAVIALLEGDPAVAEPLARAAVESRVPPTTRAWALATWSKALRGVGQIAKALEHAERAFGMMQSDNAPEAAEAWIAWARIEAREAAGDREGAASARAAARARRDERASRIAVAAWREAFLALPEHTALG